MAVDSINNLNNINSAYATQKNGRAQNMTAPIGLNNQSSGESGVIMSGAGANVCVSPAGDVLEKRASQTNPTKVEKKELPDGYTIISETDTKTGILVKRNSSDKGENAVSMEELFNPTTGLKEKTTMYDKNNHLIGVGKYDPSTGKPVSFKTYRPDSQVVSEVKFFDPKTGKQSKIIMYEKDGYTPAAVMKFNPETQKPLYTIYYDGKGKKDSVSKFNPETGQEEKRIHFNDKGDLACVSEVNEQGHEV